jgi:transposase InsO family protein
MVGPFKTAPGGLTHLLVAVDKFSKWIEAKPIKKLDGSSTIKFFNEIIVRYGVPHSVIIDNGTNFTKGVFAEFCSQKGIRLDLASVAHPQSNRPVEKANGLILAGIKPRLVEPLERSAGCWVEELPSVLWSLRTTLTALSASLLSSWSTGRGCVTHRHRI